MKYWILILLLNGAIAKADVELKTTCQVWIYADEAKTIKTGCLHLYTESRYSDICTTECINPIHDLETGKHTGCRDWDTLCQKEDFCRTQCRHWIIRSSDKKITGCKQWESYCF